MAEWADVEMELYAAGRTDLADWVHDQVAQEKAELAEQCRLLGMSGSREAKLLATLKVAEEALECAYEVLDPCAPYDSLAVDKVFAALAKIKETT